MRFFFIFMLFLACVSVKAQGGCPEDSCIRIPEGKHSGPSKTADGKKISHQVWEIPMRFVQVKSKKKLVVSHPAFEKPCTWENTVLCIGDNRLSPDVVSLIVTLTLHDGKPVRWDLAAINEL